MKLIRQVMLSFLKNTIPMVKYGFLHKLKQFTTAAIKAFVHYVAGSLFLSTVRANVRCVSIEYT